MLVFRDITERRQAESALRGAEARVRDALMQMGTPALLYAEDGELLLVNQAFVEHTGYSHADVPTVEAWTRRAYGERQPIVMATIRSPVRHRASGSTAASASCGWRAARSRTCALLHRPGAAPTPTAGAS